MTECINVYLATQPIARSLRCPSVCHVDVSKRPILLSNFFIASWPHHFSFPKGDPTVKFRRGAPSTGAPNRGEVPKICDFQPVFQIYRYRIPTYFKIPKPNTEPTTRLVETARPSTRPVLTGNRNRSPVNSGRQLGSWKPGFSLRSYIFRQSYDAYASVHVG